MLALGRVAVGVHEQVLVAVVHRLERRAGRHMDESADGHVAALGRLAEVHRERPADHDEGLLLDRVPMPPAASARLVAPQVPAGVGEAGELAQLGDVAGGLARPRAGG